MLLQIPSMVLIVMIAESFHVIKMERMLNCVLLSKIQNVLHVHWDQQIPIMSVRVFLPVIVACGNAMMAIKNH